MAYNTVLINDSDFSYDFLSEVKGWKLLKTIGTTNNVLKSTVPLATEWYLIVGLKLIANFRSIWSLVIDRIQPSLIADSHKYKCWSSMG